MKHYLVYKKIFFIVKVYLNMDNDFTHSWTVRNQRATLFTKQKAVSLSIAFNLYYQSVNN